MSSEEAEKSGKEVGEDLGRAGSSIPEKTTEAPEVTTKTERKKGMAE
ncbi:hypothetical protein M1N49_00760 [Thermodesulfovibrionales bacterium]|nr:hypothetical protein [Thermodesulfovibrionales bacterium]MCL0071198.1 hypothetical protein [Thermodesulfovibrionales bacterium]MCL0072203.1 hypothetical protein [Thermodesulfovibrionales bacterium]MCL0085362.1 hypothetical protein [Thermodesulfovibrionales bacterium]